MQIRGIDNEEFNLEDNKLNFKDNKEAFSVVKEKITNNITDIISYSRFEKLVWKTFKNKKWEDLIFNLINNCRSKQLSLSNIEWKKISELDFTYE